MYNPSEVRRYSNINPNEAYISSNPFQSQQLQKVFKYDFLSNRVITREVPIEKTQNKHSMGSALKNLYADPNPQIYGNLVQTNLLNDSINSKKKIYAGIQNDYSEIPKK